MHKSKIIKENLCENNYLPRRRAEFHRNISMLRTFFRFLPLFLTILFVTCTDKKSSDSFIGTGNQKNSGPEIHDPAELQYENGGSLHRSGACRDL